MVWEQPIICWGDLSNDATKYETMDENKKWRWLFSIDDCSGNVIKMDWHGVYLQVSKVSIYETDDAVMEFPISLLAAIGLNSDLETMYPL